MSTVATFFGSRLGGTSSTRARRGRLSSWSESRPWHALRHGPTTVPRFRLHVRAPELYSTGLRCLSPLGVSAIGSTKSPQAVMRLPRFPKKNSTTVQAMGTTHICRVSVT